MQNNAEILSNISGSRSKNTTFQKQKEESIMDEANNQVNNFKLDELKLKIQQNGNSEKINETEKVEENRNIMNNNSKIEKEDSHIESKDIIQKNENVLKNENIQENDIKQSINENPQSNLEGNQKKEDSQQSGENIHENETKKNSNESGILHTIVDNGQFKTVDKIVEEYGENIHENETKKNSNESGIMHTIVDNGQFKTIDKIVEENPSSNISIKSNNQIYFTETNILVDKTQEDLLKSDKNNLYQLTSIPENSYTKKNTISKTPLRIKNSKNILNNLSPDKYMKKKITINNESEISPLRYRIKKYEEEIQKQNEYDFKSAMKECRILYDREMKKQEREKQIQEEHKKYEEKLKNMEEHRKNLLNKRIQKIMQKSNRNNNKKNMIENKSLDYNLIYNNINKKLNGDDNIINTFDNDKGKLPPIEHSQRYKIMKLKKEQNEENFCIKTEKRMKSLELNHRINYLNHLNLINEKIIKQSELYNQRSEKCILATKDRTSELQEEYFSKDMFKRYNMHQNILRELSEKKYKMKGIILKNFENVKEKKELLQRQEEQKIKKILKRLNRQPQSLELKKDTLSVESNNQRIYFSNLQKKNLNKANKEIDEYYKELILRKEDYFWMVNDLQKDDIGNQNIIQKSLDLQKIKEKEMKSLNKFLEKMDKNNINNQKGGNKMKIFLNQKKLEIDNKKREEEEALIANNK